MRTPLSIGIAGLAFAAGAARAQDLPTIRFDHAGAPVPVAARRADPAPTPRVAVGRDAAGPTYVSLPPQGGVPDAVGPAAAIVAPVAVPVAVSVAAPATKSPVQAAAEAAPWCRSGRVVGTGTGFCMIN